MISTFVKTIPTKHFFFTKFMFVTSIFFYFFTPVGFLNLDISNQYAYLELLGLIATVGFIASMAVSEYSDYKKTLVSASLA